MDPIECPHCRTRVFPMSTGLCPACRRGLDEPLEEAPTNPAPRDVLEDDPAESPVASSTLATIRTFLFEDEAEIARDYLERQGIPAFLADAKLMAMDWLLGNAIGYTKLQVPSNEAVKAVHLLLHPGSARVDEELLPADGEPFDREAGPDDEPGTDDEGIPMERCGVLARLRRLRYPIFWLIAGPPVLGIVVLALAAIVLVVMAVAGSL